MESPDTLTNDLCSGTLRDLMDGRQSNPGDHVSRRMKTNRFWAVLICTIVGSFWQCSLPEDGSISPETSRKQTESIQLFGHRWWNYYQRGLSLMEGEKYTYAVADFQHAVLQREKDQRMARTYGMHFIDYFPHREIGIAWYESGQLETAEIYLNKSLEYTPSAKARFYLDVVRKKLIEKSGGDSTAPALLLQKEDREIWTRDDPFFVSGEAKDDQYVASIRIGHVAVYQEGSEKSVRFHEQLALSQGRNEIMIEATNLSGQSAKRFIMIHFDRVGPLITVEQMDIGETAAGKKVVVSGYVYDEGGVFALWINKKEVPILAGSEVPFFAGVEVSDDRLEIAARDRLGNETSGRIVLSDMVTSFPSAGRREKMIHRSGIRSGDLSDATPKTEPVLVASACERIWDILPLGASRLTAGLFEPDDRRPPVVTLKGWTDDQTVWMEKIYLEGQATDESRIDSLSVSGVPILRRKGRSIVFGHVASLQEGENRIVIEAKDEAGNVVVKTIRVMRRIPKALQLGQRLSVSVLPFGRSDAFSDAGFVFYDYFINALVDRNRFRVVEREKLDAMFEEQKLSRTNLMDSDTALRVGKFFAAQAIITGMIIENRAGIEIVARMIDTETAEILSTQDVYLDSKGLRAWPVIAEGMAVKFHKDFPLVDGVVLERKEQFVWIDLGQEAVKLGRKMIVYRQRPVTHPATGMTVGADDEIIDYSRVVQVSPKVSKARLQENKPDKPIPLDKVIAL